MKNLNYILIRKVVKNLYKISKRKEEFKYGKNQMVFKYNAKI